MSRSKSVKNPARPVGVEIGDNAAGVEAEADETGGETETDMKEGTTGETVREVLAECEIEMGIEGGVKGVGIDAIAAEATTEIVEGASRRRMTANRRGNM